MKTIKAVTFDFGGTLAHGQLDTENYKIALIDYIFRLGFTGGKARFIKARKAMVEKLSKAREKNRELRFEEIYEDLLVDLGLVPTREKLDFIEQLYYQFFNIDLVYGVKEMLAKLSERYNLAIISNIISNASRLALKRFNLEQYFDCVILSRDLGIRKPDPRIFKFALKELGVKSSEAVHVGDSLEQDIAGAENVGMLTVWIKSDDKNQNIHPDFIRSRVTELPKLLQSLAGLNKQEN